MDIITYSGNKNIVVPVHPKDIVQPTDIVTFVSKPPDPAIVKEAEAYFTTRKII